MARLLLPILSQDIEQEFVELRVKTSVRRFISSNNKSFGNRSKNYTAANNIIRDKISVAMSGIGVSLYKYTTMITGIYSKCTNLGFTLYKPETGNTRLLKTLTCTNKEVEISELSFVPSFDLSRVSSSSNMLYCHEFLYVTVFPISITGINTFTDTLMVQSFKEIIIHLEEHRKLDVYIWVSKNSKLNTKNMSTSEETKKLLKDDSFCMVSKSFISREQSGISLGNDIAFEDENLICFRLTYTI